jgi:thiol-disulfide isomerase/thioredoxin
MTTPPRPERQRWPARLRRLSIHLLLLLAFIAALDWYRAPDARAVADARLTTTQGEPVDFQAQSEPTVLYVWADWCGYCRHTSPAIERLQRSGHRVVSLAMQSGSDAQVHAYMRTHGLTFPVVNDPDGAISQALGVGVTPTIAIVSDGRMRLATSGWTSEYGLRLRLWLARWH